MKRAYFFGALFLSMTGLIILTGCSGSSDAATANSKKAVIPVELAAVTCGDIAAHFSGTASLEALEETGVVPKVSGVVKTLLAEEGDRVRPGQVLAHLDDEKSLVQVGQARAALDKLELQYHRDQKLFEQNLISAETFQQTKADFEVQKASFDLVKLDLEYTAIRTPIGGVVSARFIKTGNMITAQQETFRVTDLDLLLAVLYVPEGNIHQLARGQKAEIRPDALTGEKFEGDILRISPVVDPATGTVKVTVAVHDPSSRLKPGMFVRVNIVYDVRPDVILAPKSAILMEDREARVFVVRDSMAFERKVTLGYVNTVHVEIMEGLNEGDLIVTTGKSGLSDSTRVEAVGSLKETNKTK